MHFVIEAGNELDHGLGICRKAVVSEIVNRPPVGTVSDESHGLVPRPAELVSTQPAIKGTAPVFCVGGQAESGCSCPLHIRTTVHSFVIARIGSVGRLSLPGTHRGASGERQDDE